MNTKSLHNKKRILHVGASLLAIPVFLCGVLYATKKPDLDNEVVTITKYKGIKLVSTEIVPPTDREVKELYDSVKEHYAETLDKDMSEVDFSDDTIYKMTDGNYSNEEELLNGLRENILTGQQVAYREGINSQIDEIISANMQVHQYPQEEIDALIEKLKDIYEDYALDENLDILDYMKENYDVADENAYNTFLLDEAKQYIGLDVAYEQIAVKEGLLPSDEELADNILDYQKRLELTKEEVLEKYTEDELKSEYIRKKVYAYIEKKAKLKK